MSSRALDRQQAAATIRRTLAGVPVQLADGFARVVRDSPEHRLERLMRTPARRVILEGIFWQMPQHFDRERAAGVNSSIRWCITGRPDGKADTYEVEIADRRCRVIGRSAHSEPQVTITVDGVEFLRLATGSSDPMQAYFGGRIKLAGDIMLAAKLTSLFRIPARSAVDSCTTPRSPSIRRST